MHQGRLILSQIMDFMPINDFHKCVDRYHGNYKVQNISCLDQFRCMAFAQLTYRESLREIEACLRSMRSKLYHMGIRSTITRNTLANANRNRNCRNLCRLRTDANQYCSKALTKRERWCRVERNSLRTRLYYYRSMSGTVSLGHIQKTQRRREDAHVTRSTR